MSFIIESNKCFIERYFVERWPDNRDFWCFALMTWHDVAQTFVFRAVFRNFGKNNMLGTLKPAKCCLQCAMTVSRCKVLPA